MDAAGHINLITAPGDVWTSWVSVLCVAFLTAAVYVVWDDNPKCHDTKDPMLMSSRVWMYGVLAICSAAVIGGIAIPAFKSTLPGAPPHLGTVFLYAVGLMSIAWTAIGGLVVWDTRSERGKCPEQIWGLQVIIWATMVLGVVAFILGMYKTKGRF